MDPELLRLVLFAALVRLFVIAAEPAAPCPRDTWSKSRSSTVLAAL